jgi:hypothetical protein
MDKLLDSRGINARPDLSGMFFSDQIPPSTSLGLDIRVRYSWVMYHRWVFDEEADRYLRFQETADDRYDTTEEVYAPLVDDLTGEQIGADNIVVLYVDHAYYTITEGSEIYNYKLHDSGRAVVFRDGFSYEAVWVRPTEGGVGVLQLYTTDGDPFPLKPGQTWFQVLSQYSTQETNGAGWFFHFVRPPVPEGGVKLHGKDPILWFFDSQNPGVPYPEDYDPEEFEED